MQLQLACCQQQVLDSQMLLLPVLVLLFLAKPLQHLVQLQVLHLVELQVLHLVLELQVLHLVLVLHQQSQPQQQQVPQQQKMPSSCPPVVLQLTPQQQQVLSPQHQEAQQPQELQVPSLLLLQTPRLQPLEPSLPQVPSQRLVLLLLLILWQPLVLLLLPPRAQRPCLLLVLLLALLDWVPLVQSQGQFPVPFLVPLLVQFPVQSPVLFLVLPPEPSPVPSLVPSPLPQAPSPPSQALCLVPSPQQTLWPLPVPCPVLCPLCPVLCQLCPVPFPVLFQALVPCLPCQQPPPPCPMMVPCLAARPPTLSPLASHPPACPQTPMQLLVTLDPMLELALAPLLAVQAAALAAWQQHLTLPAWAVLVAWAVPQAHWVWEALQEPLVERELVPGQAWAAAAVAVSWHAAKQQHPARWVPLLVPVHS